MDSSSNQQQLPMEPVLDTRIFGAKTNTVRERMPETTTINGFGAQLSPFDFASRIKRAYESGAYTSNFWLKFNDVPVKDKATFLLNSSVIATIEDRYATGFSSDSDLVTILSKGDNVLLSKVVDASDIMLPSTQLTDPGDVMKSQVLQNVLNPKKDVDVSILGEKASNSKSELFEAISSLNSNVLRKDINPSVKSIGIPGGLASRVSFNDETGDQVEANNIITKAQRSSMVLSGKNLSLIKDLSPNTQNNTKVLPNQGLQSLLERIKPMSKNSFEQDTKSDTEESLQSDIQENDEDEDIVLNKREKPKGKKGNDRPEKPKNNKLVKEKEKEVKMKQVLVPKKIQEPQYKEVKKPKETVEYSPKNAQLTQEHKDQMSKVFKSTTGIDIQSELLHKHSAYELATAALAIISHDLIVDDYEEGQLMVDFKKNLLSNVANMVGQLEVYRTHLASRK